MEEENKDQDVFPNSGFEQFPPEFGLTKREYAAIKIMAGFAADPETDEMFIENLAKAAVEWADALFEELDK